MRLADKIATMARDVGWVEISWLDGYTYLKSASTAATALIARDGMSAVQQRIKVVPGDAIKFVAKRIDSLDILFLGREDGRRSGYSNISDGRVVSYTAPDGSAFALLCTTTDSKDDAWMSINDVVVLNAGKIASDSIYTEGGGTKCLTPRRSYRRLARPSARFCAHSQEWEVAA